MKQVIRGEKLARMQVILATQTDKKRFADKIKERFADVEEIIVVDPSGINFHYFPRKEDETPVEAKAHSPLMISKKLVEEFNATLLKEQPDEEHDFDSVEVLTAQLTHWVDKTIVKADIEFTADDIVEITAAYGLPDHGKFIYHYAKNGLLNPYVDRSQKRFSNYRNHIVDKAPGQIEVTSLIPLTITEQIAAAVNGDAKKDGTEPLLFPEDIILPVTHLKDGQTYVAQIADHALDYFGELEIVVTLETETEEPVVNP